MDVVCGVDEAGRGPIAGPVTAAAVILSPSFPVDILKDSKLLTEQQRECITALILNRAVAFAVGWCWPAEIDKINIHNATLLAMERAIISLTKRPSLVLIDGKYTPKNLTIDCRALIKGDTNIPQIQAASILAKTARDRWMVRYSWIEPNYMFEKHKGYATTLHRSLYKKYGPSAIHRYSFTVS